VHHEDLAVAVHAPADADRGDGERGRDLLRQRCRDAFQDDGKRARVLEDLGILEQPRGRGVILALHLVSPELVHGLRREADVRHDGDSRPGDPARHLGNLAAPLELDPLGPGFLHEAPGIAHGLLDRRLVGHERHVPDHHGALGRPGNGLGVVQHVLHRHGEGAVVAENDHAQRIPHEDDVDAGLVHGRRRGVVVGGQHGEALALFFHLPDCRRGNPRDLDLCAHPFRPPFSMARIAASLSSPTVPLRAAISAAKRPISR